ncbi:MAG: DUF4065 domain-containing protein [Xanthobacteraceae bacterium]|nr:MAG: DUF4065 domain-containing protein [Xanthobacteraceae bacterium]
MAVPAFAAARRVCERGEWRVTNLSLQKILYLAQMVHMGTNNGSPLIDGHFEAWDYGPVEPNVYHKVKFFGDQPINDIFFSSLSITGTPEASTIDRACDYLLTKSPGELVAMTHWNQGAWAKNYKPGVMGIVIPDRDIIAEYFARTSA